MLKKTVKECMYNASVQISDSLPIEQLQFNSLIIFYEI
jgi:hypothetical protein